MQACAVRNILKMRLIDTHTTVLDMAETMMSMHGYGRLSASKEL